MHTGMMWFYDTKNALSAEIQKAADHYTRKFGRKPNLCLLHPSADTASVHIDGLIVRPWRPVLPSHIWIGIEGIQPALFPAPEQP